MLIVLASAGSVRAEPPTAPDSWVGRPLVEALTELQDRGLKLVFSDRVVDPSLRVETEPRDGSAVDILSQLLEPHGLEAQRSSTGWLVVVRSRVVEPAPAPEPRTEVRAPEALDIPRVSDAIVVTPTLRLPVHVTHEGEPVRGLSRDDFRLSINGNRREITDLEVLDLTAPRALDSSVAELPSAIRRHFLLAFDTGLESPGSLARARELARELVEKVLHPADMVGLATLSEVRRPQFALFFTSDRLAALAAIDAVAGRKTHKLISDPLGLAVRPAHPTSGRRVAYRKSTAHSLDQARRIKAVDGNLTVSEYLEDLRPVAARADRQAALTRLLGLADSLHDLARSLRFAPGRKHVIFFSEGFDDSMLVGLEGGSTSERELIEEMNRAAETGQFWKVDSDQRYGNDAAQSSFDRMLDEFAYGNSVVHAVDTRLDPDGVDSGQSRNGLIALARRTGGAYFSGTGSLAPVLESLDQRTSVTYVLSFAPPPKKKGRRQPKLRVRLRDGLQGRVLHPPVVPVMSTGAELTNEQRLLLAAGRIAGGRAGGDFPSRLTVGAVREGGLEPSVQLSVKVEGLHAGDAPPPQSAEVFVYALAADGEIRDFFGRSFYAPAGLPRESSFEVEGRLRLLPGRYSLRSLVLYPDSGASSLAAVELDVRSF